MKNENLVHITFFKQHYQHGSLRSKFLHTYRQACNLPTGTESLKPCIAPSHSSAFFMNLFTPAAEFLFLVTFGESKKVGSMSSSQNFMFLAYYFNQPVKVHYHNKKPCENVAEFNSAPESQVRLLIHGY